MEEQEGTVEVLLVEDNPGDARLTQEALKDSKYEVSVSVAEDGEIALSRLRKEGEFADTLSPELILLDLQLPKRSGLEVLAEINKDEGLRHIPVVVLTGTSAEGSMLQSYGISPSRFMRKPVNVARFDVTMTTLRSYSQREAEQSPEVSVAESPAAPMGRWWWPFG